MRIIVFFAIFVGVMGGGYAYMKYAQFAEKAGITQECVQKYSVPPRNKLIKDAKGFCECSANIEQPFTVEEAKALGRSCMEQYGKQNLLRMCEDMNVEIKNRSVAAKTVNCGCFYEELMGLFSDEMIAQKTSDLPKEKRDEVVWQAFTKCRNTSE